MMWLSNGDDTVKHQLISQAKKHVRPAIAYLLGSFNNINCPLYQVVKLFKALRMTSNSYIYFVKTQLAAGKYSILCQFCGSIRDSKLYARPASEEENMQQYAQAYLCPV